MVIQLRGVKLTTTRVENAKIQISRAILVTRIQLEQVAVVVMGANVINIKGVKIMKMKRNKEIIRISP